MHYSGMDDGWLLLEGARTFHARAGRVPPSFVAFLRVAKPLLEDDNLGRRKAEGDIHAQWWS